LESTNAKLAAKHGRDLDLAKSEQARDWVTRLPDILDSDPGMAPALQALIANPSGVLHIANRKTLYAFGATGSAGCAGTPRDVPRCGRP
jgi:hypothetical protein